MGLHDMVYSVGVDYVASVRPSLSTSPQPGGLQFAMSLHTL